MNALVLGLVLLLQQVVPSSEGPRVVGRVSGIPVGSPAGAVRVVFRPVSGVPSSYSFWPVQSDGVFEAQKVRPGTYDLQLLPNLAAAPLVRIEVGDRDASGVELNFGEVVTGRVMIEGGGGLPTGMAFSFQGRRSDGSSVSVVSMHSDGSFIWPVARSEYHIDIRTLPIGYSVKSISRGSIDLMREPLRISSADVADEIRVVLSPVNADGIAGVKVSGRVTGLPKDDTAASRWVRMQSVRNPSVVTMRLMELPMKSDGSFEFVGVPPGAYSLSFNPSVGFPSSITVDNQDVLVDLPYRPPAPFHGYVGTIPFIPRMERPLGPTAR